MKTHNDKGQVYHLLGTEPYTRKDGTVTTLETWGATCTHPGCTAIYTVTAPQGSESKSFGSRRCHDHKMTRAEVLAKAREGKAAKKQVR